MSSHIDPAKLPAHAVKAAADALASRLVDPAFGPTHFQLKMREMGRARVALAAGIEALLNDDEAMERAVPASPPASQRLEAIRAALAAACQEDPT